MNTRFFCILALSLSLLGGCASLLIPAVTGVSGNTLFRTGYPTASITANAPLSLQGHGRVWAALYNQDSLTVQPSGNVSYAVYSDSNSGPVTRHAHALMVQPDNDRLWYFPPESYKTFGALSFGAEEREGQTWTTQIVRVPSEDDWFSALWAENGRQTPPVWIAKRFSATPARDTRLVAEYREPWPTCLDTSVSDLIFVSGACLKGFFERADAAFTLERQAPGQTQPTAAPGTLKSPPFPPNTKKLVGEVRREDSWSIRRW